MSPLSAPLQALCDMYRSDPDNEVDVDVGLLFQPRVNTVPAWDPSLKRFGTLWLDGQYIRPTAALQAVEDVAEGQRPPVLCLPFLDGQCPAAETCPKLHVAPEYVLSVRQRLCSMTYNDCCLGHGDLPSLRRDFRNALSRMSIVITTEAGAPIPVPPDRVAVTLFWKPFLVRPPTTLHDTVKFRSVRICRLHQMGTCRLGRDCKNLHVCREFWGNAGLAETAHGPLSATVPLSGSFSAQLPPTTRQSMSLPVSASGGPQRNASQYTAQQAGPHRPLTPPPQEMATSSAHIPPPLHYSSAMAQRSDPVVPPDAQGSDRLLFLTGNPACPLGSVFGPIQAPQGSGPIPTAMPQGDGANRCLTLLGWGLPFSCNPPLPGHPQRGPRAASHTRFPPPGATQP